MLKVHVQIFFQSITGVHSFIHSFIHLFIHFSIMCVIGRGRGGGGEKCWFNLLPPPPFFQAVPSACLCKVGDGGGGVSGGRSNPRAWGGAQPMSAQIALFPTNGRPVVRMV